MLDDDQLEAAAAAAAASFHLNKIDHADGRTDKRVPVMRWIGRCDGPSLGVSGWGPG